MQNQWRSIEIIFLIFRFFCMSIFCFFVFDFEKIYISSHAKYNILLGHRQKISDRKRKIYEHDCTKIQYIHFTTLTPKIVYFSHLYFNVIAIYFYYIVLLIRSDI